MPAIEAVIGAAPPGPQQTTVYEAHKVVIP
jgi:hypothetical protein